MKLQNSFRLAESPDRVLDLLLDVERIAECLPGSQLTGRDGDAYEGHVKVKVGPLSVAYHGSVRFIEVDRESRSVALTASGREQRGQGDAQAHVMAHVEPDADGSKVSLDTDLMIRGKVAQFGRGVIGDVSQRMMDEFARNVEGVLRGGGDTPGRLTAPSSASSDTSSRLGRNTQPTSEATLNGLQLIAVPLLKRSLPAVTGFATGFLIGLLVGRPRTR